MGFNSGFKGLIHVWRTLESYTHLYTKMNTFLVRSLRPLIKQQKMKALSGKHVHPSSCLWHSSNFCEIRYRNYLYKVTRKCVFLENRYSGNSKLLQDEANLLASILSTFSKHTRWSYTNLGEIWHRISRHIFARKWVSQQSVPWKLTLVS